MSGGHHGESVVDCTACWEIAYEPSWYAVLNASEGFIHPWYISMGIAVWLAIIMWFNVWFVIWPNQQKALNIGNAFPDLPAAEKAKAARTAGMFSRTNTMLSVPMLFCMVAAPHLA